MIYRVSRTALCLTIAAQLAACAVRHARTPETRSWSECADARSGQSIVIAWNGGARSRYTLKGTTSDGFLVQTPSGANLEIQNTSIDLVSCHPPNAAVARAQLRDSLGKRVEVEMFDGSRYSGTLETLNDKRLALRVGRGPKDFGPGQPTEFATREISLLDVWTVKRRDVDRPLEGFAIGLGVGLALEWLTHDDGSDGLATHLVQAGAITGAIGLLIDLAIQGEKIVYEVSVIPPRHE